MADAVMDIIVRAVDQASQTFNNVEGAIDSAETAAKNVSNALDQTDNSMKKAKGDAQAMDNAIEVLEKTIKELGNTSLSSDDKIQLLEQAMDSLGTATKGTSNNIDAVEESTALMSNALSALNDDSISTASKMEIIDEAMENISRSMNKGEQETHSFRKTLGETATQAVDSLTDMGIGFANAFGALQAAAANVNVAKASLVGFGIAGVTAAAAITYAVSQTGVESGTVSQEIGKLGPYFQGASQTVLNEASKMQTVLTQLGADGETSAKLLSTGMKEYGLTGAQVTAAIQRYAADQGISFSEAAKKIGESPEELKKWAPAADQASQEVQTVVDNLGSDIVSKARQFGTQFGGDLGGFMAQGMVENLPMVADLIAGTLVAATVQYTGAKIFSSTANSADAAATVADTAAKQGQAVATAEATTAQTGLNLSFLSSPIFWVVAAVIILVGALWYLYNTNEGVRNAINGLWAGLQSLGAYILGGLMAAWNAIAGTLSYVWTIIQQLVAVIYGNLLSAWISITTVLEPLIGAFHHLWVAISNVFEAFMQNKAEEANSQFATLTAIATALWNALSWLAGIIGTALSPVFQVLQIVLTALAEVLSGLFSAAWTTVSGIIMAVINHFARVINIIAALINGNITAGQALSAIWESIKLMFVQVLMSIILGIGGFIISLGAKARAAGLAFINGIINYIRSLPARLWVLFLLTLARILAFANASREKARQVAINIVNTIKDYLTKLPGNMYTWGMNALDRFVNGIVDKIPGLRGALDTISGLFPHSPPKEGPLSKIKPENMYLFGEDLGNNLVNGVNNSTGNLFNNLGNLPSIPAVSASTPGTNITPNVDTQSLTESVTAADNQYTILKTANATALSSMVSTTSTSFNAIKNSMQTTLNDVVASNKTGYTNIQNNTKSVLDTLRIKTKTDMGNVKSSWNGMRDSLTEAAKSVKINVEKKIDGLSKNIGTFYKQIRNPALLVAGPAPGYAGPRNISVPTMSRSFAGPSTNQFDLLESAWLYPCLSPDGCYAGAWDDYAPNWTSSINSTVGNYTPNFSPYGSLGLKATDFTNTSMPLQGSMALFEAMADKLIATTNYDFYYNGRYNNAEALRHGAFNCWDGAEILVSLAHALGLNATMVHGHWGSVGHMAAKVNGTIFDTTQRQQRGVWRGTPGVGFAGPIPKGFTHSNSSSEVIRIEDELKLSLDISLNGVPEDIDENSLLDALKEIITDSALLKAIVNDRTFLSQLLAKLKSTNSRQERYLGVG